MAASMSASGRGSRAPITGINMTPMVDIMLVLLIILMVAATYIVSQSLKVELPRTASSDETVTKTFVVTITKDGKYYFNQKPTTKAALTNELKTAVLQNPELNLVITADQGALHGQVVGVIDLAKVEGINKFAINVERQ
jgi:biopolymer transport protein ExbD